MMNLMTIINDNGYNDDDYNILVEMMKFEENDHV